MNNPHNKITVLGLLSHSSTLEEHKLIHGVDLARIVNPLLYLDPEKFEVSLRMDALKYEPLIRDDNKKNFINWRGVASYYDIIFYSYTVSPQWYVNMAFHAEKFGSTVIMDIDDNIWEVPARSGAYDAFHPGSPEIQVVEAQIANNKYLVTTKELTKKSISRHTGAPVEKFYVNPNYIDLKMYDASRIERKADDKIRICYFGTNTHFDDIANNRNLVRAIDKLILKYDNLEIFTIGFFLPELKTRWKKHYFSMTGDRDVYGWAKNLWVQIMSMADIAIAPLLVTNFTSCKSNIKYLECAAAKKPTVCQKIDQYESTITNGVDGYLAETEDEWFEYLDGLIASKELREKVGNAAYKNIVDNHQIQNNHKKFEDYLTFVDKDS